MIVTEILVRGWPGTRRWSSPAPPSDDVSLRWRPALIVFFAGLLDEYEDRPVTPERTGLGAVLLTDGSSLSNGALIVPDDCDRSSFGPWASTDLIETIAGPKPWNVVTVGEFFDPLATIEDSPWAFYPNAYSGCLPVIGAHLGRTVGLTAEHAQARRGKHRDDWKIWPPGVGKVSAGGRLGKRSPHRPPLYLSAGRVGWSLQFAPVERRSGKWVGGSCWRGEFIDTLPAAYVVDGQRGASLSEHRENLGLAPFELPLAVRHDEDGARKVARSVLAILELALTISDRAEAMPLPGKRRARRQEGVIPFSLARTTSGGGVAATIPARLGVTPPLAKFDLSDEEHARFASGAHGGLNYENPRFRAVPFEAGGADMKNAFALGFHCIGGWDVLRAERLVRQDVRDELVAMGERALEHPEAVVCDPAISRRFGVTLVETIFEGELGTVALPDPRRPDGRLERAPLFTEGRSVFLPWPDWLAASISSERALPVLSATHYHPEGAQTEAPDPILFLVRQRWLAKKRGDLARAAALRVIGLAFAYGNNERSDDGWTRVGRRWVREETRPGPWAFPPIGATVPAWVRLQLALAERRGASLGTVVAYGDTDSLDFPASAEGGTLTLPDGSAVQQVSHDELDWVFEPFERLSPAPWWPVWSIERGFRMVTFGPKRYVKFRTDDDSIEVIDATETNLGGTYLDPSGMRGRVTVPDGFRQWSMAGVKREAAFVLARQADQAALRPSAPWDTAADEPFPAMRPFSVRTPAMLRALPKALGAWPGSRYLEVSRATWLPDQPPLVALDPGGDPDSWSALRWLDKQTGEEFWISTDSEEAECVTVEDLDQRVIGWSEPPQTEEIDAVVTRTVHPVGRASPVLDAAAEGKPGSLADHRAKYRSCGCGCGSQIPPGRRYKDSTHRKEARRRRSRNLQTREILCACGCNEAISGDQRSYVDSRHRERAKKRRQRSAG